jgi:hypothetical protein
MSYPSQIKARRHQVKGEIKTVARAVACGSNGYSFAAGTDAKSINDNRDLVRNLLDEDGFVYRVCLACILILPQVIHVP